jgi:hypothetical protein
MGSELIYLCTERFVEETRPSGDYVYSDPTYAVATLVVATSVGLSSAARWLPLAIPTRPRRQRAKTMDFGIHLIKKNRWVKDCIGDRSSRAAHDGTAETHRR